MSTTNAPAGVPPMSTSAPPGVEPMPDDFTGTNTEKIDKLIAAVVEMRATIRLVSWFYGLAAPSVVALAIFVLGKTYDTSVRVGQVETRLGQVESRLDKVESRLDKVDTRLGQVEGRLEKVDTRLGQMEAQLGRIEKLLDKQKP